MTRTVIVVLDGFGIGAMPDAGVLRPEDTAADTLAHVLDHGARALGRPLRLPTLGALGLGLVHPHLPAPGGRLPVSAGRVALGYPGADTFAGHHTMMGADCGGVAVTRIGEHLDEVTQALRCAGHTVRLLDSRPLLTVDGGILVHDNLEADPGVNWNVSARLEDHPFDQVLSVARTVRSVAPVARVIAVAGHARRPLAAYVREGAAGTVGLDTPASGFYVNGGLQVQHLGAELDHESQLPSLAARAGLPVTLIGKAADILPCPTAARHPAVPTREVLAHTLRAAGSGDGLVVANVQETDLAGHQQDVRRYARVIEQVDAGLAELLAVLDSLGDHLIVTGDHGNDPTVGHAHHTREYVPLLVHAAGGAHDGGPQLLPDAGSLTEVGARAAASLGLRR